MILIRNLRLETGEGHDALPGKAAKKLRIAPERIGEWRLVKKSLDARKKNDIHHVCAVACEVEGKLRVRDKDVSDYAPPVYEIPRVRTDTRPVVAGFGPAGMFAALVLAKAGARPIVLERGQDALTRLAAVEAFRAGGALDPENNVQFGEGGAGTFSDGKLNTGTHDPRLHWVLEQFAAHGAPESVRFDAKPHIGTDILVDVVQAFRREIVSLGGEVRFGAKLTGLRIEDGRLCGVEVNHTQTLPCRALILAVGHSARDTFEMLHALGIPMEAKPFSMGVRIEHRQAAVDLAQYGRERGELPAADYSLNVRLPDGSSAYSFCMCPGGQVFAAASEEGGVCWSRCTRRIFRARACWRAWSGSGRSSGGPSASAAGTIAPRPSAWATFWRVCRAPAPARCSRATGPASPGASCTSCCRSASAACWSGPSPRWGQSCAASTIPTRC